VLAGVTAGAHSEAERLDPEEIVALSRRWNAASSIQRDSIVAALRRSLPRRRGRHLSNGGFDVSTSNYRAFARARSAQLGIILWHA